MSNTPENPTNKPMIDQNTTKKGGMGFKLSLFLLLVLAGTGGAGYLAYERGLANPYLPEILQKKQSTEVAVTPTAPDSTPAVTPTTQPPAETPVATTTPAPTTPDANSTTGTATNGTTTPTDPANPSTATNASTPTTPTTPTTAATTPATSATGASAQMMPAVPHSTTAHALSNASTVALLTTLDAQNQWQALQYDFHQNWDTASALQQIQMLKNQLQTANNSALLPSITALSQVEGQIQTWNALNPKANLATLQQSVTDLNKLTIRTTEERQKVEATNSDGSWWGRFMASLKQVFQVKRVNTNEVQALDTAVASIVKQGINANLMAALWSARDGQWATAQEQIRMANDSVQKYGQGYTLDALKPLMDNTAWPSQPDFSVVQQALMQARAQLTAQMQSELGMTAPAPTTTPAPSTAPTTTPPQTAPANSNSKGVAL